MTHTLIGYARCSTDPGIKDALGFLMTREVAHQKSFEKALYAIETTPVGQAARLGEVRENVRQHFAG